MSSTYLGTEVVFEKRLYRSNSKQLLSNRRLSNRYRVMFIKV